MKDLAILMQQQLQTSNTAVMSTLDKLNSSISSSDHEATSSKKAILDSISKLAGSTMEKSVLAAHLGKVCSMTRAASLLW